MSYYSVVTDVSERKDWDMLISIVAQLTTHHDAAMLQAGTALEIALWPPSVPQLLLGS